MNDGLNPIKHVYGEEPVGQKPAPGTPEYVEFEALRSMKEVLDDAPRPLPDASLVNSLTDAAGLEALRPLLHVYGEEGGELATNDERGAEVALLQSTKAAVEALPRQRPDASMVDVIKSAASAAVAAPLLAAYGEAEPPQTDSDQYVEYALLSGAKAALDQLPPQRPDASAIAAVLAAAAPGAPAMKVAADRPANSRSTIRRWMPTMAMAASLVIVAVTGLWVVQQNPLGTQANEGALVADAEVAPPQAAQQEPAAALEEADIVKPETSPFGTGGQPTIAEERMQDFVAARRSSATTSAPTPSASSPPPPVVVADAAPSERSEAGFGATGGAPGSMADTNTPASTVSAWEAGEDVRVLSLRLNQLANSSEGLSWDEPPVPLGASELDGAAANEAIRAVRAGSSPARVDVQLRSSELPEN